MDLPETTTVVETSIVDPFGLCSCVCKSFPISQFMTLSQGNRQVTRRLPWRLFWERQKQIGYQLQKLQSTSIMETIVPLGIESSLIEWFDPGRKFPGSVFTWKIWELCIKAMNMLYQKALFPVCCTSLLRISRERDGNVGTMTAILKLKGWPPGLRPGWGNKLFFEQKIVFWLLCWLYWQGPLPLGPGDL